jgi:hypothetical protein
VIYNQRSGIQQARNLRKWDTRKSDGHGGSVDNLATTSAQWMMVNEVDVEGSFGS